MHFQAVVIAIFIFGLGSAASAVDRLIELSTPGRTVQGRQLAHDRLMCRLIDREGAFHEVLLEDVTGFREVSPKFKPSTVAEVRERLSQGLDRRMEVTSRGNYVVCAPRGTARAYAEVLDRASQQFLAYLRVRKFPLTPLQYPLIAYVHPNRREFLERCSADGTPAGDSLRGYYHPRSNWILLFHEDEESPAKVALAALKPKSGTSSGRAAQRQTPETAADLDPMVRQTAVHEAIHQLAFNTGLHSRTGENPLWVVEGLAMQFESALSADESRTTKLGVNAVRLRNFAEYRQRRPTGGLSTILVDEQAFRANPLEAYGEAWMLSHYLLQTRPTKYSEYLKHLSQRPDDQPYSSEERLADFKTHFGSDPAWFEVEYLRYADDLIATEQEAQMLRK